MQTSLAQDLYNFEPLNMHPIKLAALRKVLIVEDDLSLTNLLTYVLEEISPDVEVDWATSGEEAEYYLQRESKYYGGTPYDLVIADIFLEGKITGLDIWKLCDEKYPNTNILVTSSLPTDKFLSSIKNEDSCPPYLPKPFTMKECKEALEEFI